jgi:hypothetical protein
MSDKINDGGPAFPWELRLDNGAVSYSPGMSLRDYFAGQALAGYLACPDLSFTNSATLARDCYGIADAMLKAREAGR